VPTNPLVGLLSPKVRQIVYLILVLAGIALAVMQIIFDPDPYWLNKAEEVLAYLGTIGIGTLAASNIARADPQPGPDVVEDGYIPERALNDEDRPPV
jgi:hypothetical protein